MSGGQIGALVIIVIAVAALGFFVFSRACGTAECTEVYCPSSRNIEAPEGFEFVSKIFEYTRESGAAQPGFNLAVQVALTEPVTDSGSLSFYRFVEESSNWEPITPAVLDPQGEVVTATFTDAPAIMAVLRRTTPGGSVVAYLPPNGTLHPDAVPHVTLVHTLDFTPQADGSLAGTLSKVEAAGSFEVYPVVFSNASTQGSVAIVESILSSPASRTNHVQQLLARANEFNVKGLDIAYLDLPVTQRTSFTLFVGELYQALHSVNKQLTLTLPAPTVTQSRVDEGAYDYAELAKTADLIQIAPYRDQGTYRLVMPEILRYLTERMPSGKLVLTVSPYATETGGETIRTMPIVEAMNIATRISIRAQTDAITTSTQIDVAGTNIDREENLTGVRWHPQSATVAFSYKQAQGGGSRTIYLENFFSIGFKLELVSSYRLGGVAIEDASANTYLGNIWTALTPFITSGQPILMRPNEADLQPRWAASGSGTIEALPGGAARWFTPAEPGTYTISLTLSDGVALFENNAPVNVLPRDGGASSQSAGN
ncbi:MAG TPA: glycosyl hydrolase family 18 protein [Tepidiformaceae bacterium]|nr:glycosyl hydrolase family 18 protein [Tepidiformaceae bacterium]